MKRTVTLGVVTSLLALGVATTRAQTDTNNTVTLQAQPLNVVLSGWAQNGASVTPVRINTKDVLNALGAAMGTNASARARLVLLTDDQNNQAIVVREMNGRTPVDTDVSGFFGRQTVLSVERSNANSRGRLAGVRYAIDQFSFGSTDTNSPTRVSFTVQGFTTSNLSNSSFVSQVNGTGNVTDKGDAVLRGTISGAGAKSETHVVPQ
jgi:hypothetical protein